jgi:hypothetical protein
MRQVDFYRLPIDQRRAWMNQHHPVNEPSKICGNCQVAFRSLTPGFFMDTCAWGGACNPFESHQPPVHQPPVHQPPVHQQPAHHQAMKECPSGGGCPIRNCTKGTHPKDCRWGKQCTKTGCSDRHYGLVHCPFGGRCTDPNCTTKQHPQPCRSGNTCSNKLCPFTHALCRWDEKCTRTECPKWHPTKIANALKLPS